MIKFGIISDVQYAAQESFNPERRPATLGITKLTSAVDELNGHDLDFIINLGDTIDRDPENFLPILNVLSKSRAPVWQTLGNHDFAGGDYEPGYKSEALAALGMTEDTRYYYKDLAAWRFIVLDTNEVGTIAHKEGSPEWSSGHDYRLQLESQGKLNALPWNGGVSEAQLDWLEASIDSAAKDGRSCIIFAHHPIYPVHDHNVLNDVEVLKLLSTRPNVKAYFNGHNHDGNYGINEGLHCWTVEGMMDYRDQTAYAVATLDDDTLTIRGYGRTADRHMKLRS